MADHFSAAHFHVYIAQYLARFVFRLVAETDVLEADRPGESRQRMRARLLPHFVLLRP